MTPAATSAPETVTEDAPRSRRHQRLVLAGSITGAVIVAVDGTVLTMAQPTLQRDLDASLAQVQWTSTAYLIAVAGLLVLAGRLGDRYGHRRLFAVGILGFAATSAALGLAPGIGWVIALRAAQGVFGALLQPATLGMLRAVYPRDRLGGPLALRTGAIGLAAAAGPLIGGALVTHAGWRSVFLIGVVPALAAGVLALAVRIPEPRPATAAGLDLPGAALLAAALMCLVHTLVTLPQPGRPAATAAGFAATAVAAAAFVHRQRRTTSPLIPPSVLRTPAVTHGLGVLLCASAALFGALFLATYLLQDVLALDPLTTGLWMLPLAVTMVLAAPASAALARRQGPRRTTAAGMTLLALGALAMSRLDQGSGAWATGVCCALLGAGFGTVMVTATTVVVQRAPRDAAGVTGGLQQTAMNTGPALGVATATMLTGLTAPGPTLAALAGIALLGAFLATRLPDGERRARTRP